MQPPRRSAVVDALVEIQWQKKKYRFAAEVKPLSTPKSLDLAVFQIRRASEQRGLYPLVVTTFLSEENLRRFEREGISGLDLCGNGVLVVPGELLVWRSGQANRYPRGTTIRNVYRGRSSIVARAFLATPHYDSVQELLDTIRARGGEVTLGTVSKVCSILAEDLIIERQERGRTTTLTLLQPAKLLEALAANFQPPTVGRRFLGTCSLRTQSLVEVLASWQTDRGGRIVRTGTASTEYYATMAREPVARFYCTQLATLLDVLGSHATETTRFPNLELLEVTDPTVYFDVRNHFVASPIQCFLELQAGDKRDQDTAEQVRRLILRGMDDRGFGS